MHGPCKPTLIGQFYCWKECCQASGDGVEGGCPQFSPDSYILDVCVAPENATLRQSYVVSLGISCLAQFIAYGPRNGCGIGIGMLW